MENRKSILIKNGALWFGASVSIAEILTGTAIAPLGFAKGTAAICIGHLIGCLLMYMAGRIGEETGLSAMETVRKSFGRYGSIFFAGMNVLQLVGWTAVMTGQGAAAAAAAGRNLSGNYGIWAAIIGILILCWILFGISNITKLNIVVMFSLFILTLLLSIKLFKPDISILNVSHVESSISFGTAVELSAAMPLSWLPLISDYTGRAKSVKGSAAVSSAVYFAGSCWMFVIGTGAAILTGAGDIPGILLAAGFGTAGLLIVILSTITTTFLDAYSAGVSMMSIENKLNEKLAAAAVTIIGTLVAVFAPLGSIEGFLYLIGSIFAPMVAILITDYFILKKDSFETTINVKNAIIWIIGFVLYRYYMSIETPIGNTIPVIILLVIICIICGMTENKLKR